MNMGRTPFLIFGAIVFAVALAGCASKPPLDRDGIERVQFTSFEASQTWTASPAEVSRFVYACGRARAVEDKGGTTPPARIDVELGSGEAMVITGGGETYSSIDSEDPPLNVIGFELHELLRDIAQGP